MQSVIDNCGKNYPTMKKIKTLFSQMYDYAMKNEICNKDYSGFVNILQYKDRNPDKRDRDKFTKDEIARVWTMQEDPYYQIILMLLYSGVRINIFTNLLFFSLFNQIHFIAFSTYGIRKAGRLLVLLLSLHIHNS